MAETQAGKQDTEGLDLVVAAGECRWAGAGTGGVRVVDRVDQKSLQTFTEFIQIT